MTCLTLDWFWEQEGIKVQKIDLMGIHSPLLRDMGHSQEEILRETINSN